MDSEGAERSNPKAPRRRRWLRWAFDLVLLLAVVLAVGAWQTRGLPRGAAPAFTLASLDGGTVTSASLRGKPAVLVFWAPWCGVCAAESGNISWLKRIVGDDVRVVSIASEYESLESVRAYVEKHDVDYAVLLGGKKTAESYRVQAFPTVFFVDAEGQIRHAVLGYTTLLGLWARTVW